MNIIQRLVQLLFVDRNWVNVEQYTPEFLELKKYELGMEKYPKWLKRQYVILGAEHLERKEKTLPPERLEQTRKAIQLVETEIESIYREGAYGSGDGDSWKLKL